MAITESSPAYCIAPWPLSNREAVDGGATQSADGRTNATQWARSDISPTEALSISVCAFVAALAEHLDQGFEETEHLLCRVSLNLWSMVDSPDGWAALGLLLSPPASGLPVLMPTKH